MAKNQSLAKNLLFPRDKKAPFPPILAIVGPTASGKSALALQLAQSAQNFGNTPFSPIEIISMDSALVYSEMDIGTAKPTLAQRSAIAHHLIDICTPDMSHSAADFVANARHAIEDIRARHRIPVLVGGTMMYLHALTHGLDRLPKADPHVRLQLAQEAQQMGWPDLHRRLVQIDPTTAARLAPQDAQRIGRALEVYMISGQPLSALLTHTTSQLPIDMVSLEPADRADLHGRIARRFEEILAQGFMEEVKQLRKRYTLTPTLPAMRCVGYRQAWEHLEGVTTYAQFKETSIVATRQLAKRQLTWLRAIPKRTIFNPFDTQDWARALNYCQSRLGL